MLQLQIRLLVAAVPACQTPLASPVPLATAPSLGLSCRMVPLLYLILDILKPG